DLRHGAVLEHLDLEAVVQREGLGRRQRDVLRRRGLGRHLFLCSGGHGKREPQQHRRCDTPGGPRLPAAAPCPDGPPNHQRAQRSFPVLFHVHCPHDALAGSTVTIVRLVLRRYSRATRWISSGVTLRNSDSRRLILPGSSWKSAKEASRSARPKPLSSMLYRFDRIFTSARSSVSPSTGAA